MNNKKFKDTTKMMVQAENLADVADRVDALGGYRKQIADHINQPSRASSLSEVIAKLKNKGGSVAKLVNSPVTKKLGMALAGPVGLGLSTAQDVLASDEANLGSDQVGQFPMEEALLEQPYENFADKDVSEQARRFQKIRALLENK
jgi:hypothetical protein